MTILIYGKDGTKRPYDKLCSTDRMLVIATKGEETWIGVEGITSECNAIIAERQEDTG